MSERRQPRKKRAKMVASIEETPVGSIGDDAVGDPRGYLAVGLAATIVVIVALVVLLVIQAAT